MGERATGRLAMLGFLIHQDLPRGDVQFIELSGSNRPEKTPKTNTHEDQADWHQHENDIHDAEVPSKGSTAGGAARSGEATEAQVGPPRIRRNEFKTTTIELKDMPMAAIQGGTQPSAARGMAVRL